VEVNAAVCKGCGSCMATCPKKGIYVAGFTPEQLTAQVDAALGIPPLPPETEEAILPRPLAREVAGKKFMCDGTAYLTRDDARQTMEKYQNEGLEVHMFLEEDKYLVYTRKLVTQTA